MANVIPAATGVSRLQQPAVGELAARLRIIYKYVVLAFFTLVFGALISVSLVLEKQREIEVAQRYAKLALKLDTNLNRISSQVIEILYNERISLIPRVLADNESLVLNYQTLLARADFEQKLNATETANENQPALSKLRQELAVTLVMSKATGGATAADHFESGPRFLIAQLQDYLLGIVELAEEYVDIQHAELDALQTQLLILFAILILVALSLLAFALNRVGKATEELERSLVTTLARVSREERLLTLGKVAGMVSHELRNPLGTIRTSVFSLRSKLSGQPAEVEKVLARIDRNILRSDAIVSGLLDFVRQPKITLRSGNLRDWLVALLHELDIPEGVALVLPKNDIGMVRFDNESLRRSVINVCTNANQAMVPFGATVDKGKQAGQLRITVERDEQRALMVFQDTGGGIEAEHMDHLFEPLFSTKTYGVGLGMSIVQQLMERQQGGVDVSSSPGGGTTVTLWLPDGQTMEQVA